MVWHLYLYMQALTLGTHVLTLTVDRIVSGNPQSSSLILYCPKVSLKIRIFKIIITKEFMEIISCNCMHSVLAGKLKLALRPQSN